MRWLKAALAELRARWRLASENVRLRRQIREHEDHVRLEQRVERMKKRIAALEERKAERGLTRAETLELRVMRSSIPKEWGDDPPRE